MRLDHDSDELSPGRLFIHGRLNDPMTGGPLYCRILSFDAAWVEYEPIYHREDGSERIGSLRRLPIGGFLEALSAQSRARSAGNEGLSCQQLLESKVATESPRCTPTMSNDELAETSGARLCRSWPSVVYVGYRAPSLESSRLATPPSCYPSGRGRRPHHFTLLCGSFAGISGQPASGARSA